MSIAIFSPDIDGRRLVRARCGSCEQVHTEPFVDPTPETVRDTFGALGWRAEYIPGGPSLVECPTCRIFDALNGTTGPTAFRLVATRPKEQPGRISFEAYAKRLAAAAAERSTCGRAKIGAVAMTEDHRILATSYNGSAAGSVHCMDLPKPVVFAGHDMLCEHAEVNIVDQLRVAFDSVWDVLWTSSRPGMDKTGLFVDWVRSQGITVYTSGPRETCTYCAKYCYRHGIKAVVASPAEEGAA